MGLFDELIGAVESGAVEDRLQRFADTIEHAAAQVSDKAAQLADLPASVIDAAKPDKNE